MASLSQRRPGPPLVHQPMKSVLERSACRRCALRICSGLRRTESIKNASIHARWTRKRRRAPRPAFVVISAARSRPEAISRLTVSSDTRSSSATSSIVSHWRADVLTARTSLVRCSSMRCNTRSTSPWFRISTPEATDSPTNLQHRQSPRGQASPGSWTLRSAPLPLPLTTRTTFANLGNRERKSTPRRRTQRDSTRASPPTMKTAKRSKIESVVSSPKN